MNRDEEKPGEDLWSAKPGTLLPQMHHTLQEGAWTELPLSFSAPPLVVEGPVRWLRYCVTTLGESASTARGG